MVSNIKEAEKIRNMRTGERPHYTWKLKSLCGIPESSFSRMVNIGAGCKGVKKELVEEKYKYSYCALFPKA